ncbi:Mog1p/PsbP-like protein [Phlegmacium glaucopus]|nr:Mog1p/PsbP-like protein [Phlegmacium glaucopus]
MIFVRDLFGGAITAQTVPTLIDASDLRHVPNTQEVFMYPDSSVSIIVEILQRVESSTGDGAIRLHFDSLAHDNSAQSVEIEETCEIRNDRGNNTPPAMVLKGVQFIPKFNLTVADKVRILMALFRVESKAVDVVVTFNIPVVSVDGGAVGNEDVAKYETDFDTFIRSFHIIDFGLFA